jgi:hypothetical protein
MTCRLQLLIISHLKNNLQKYYNLRISCYMENKSLVFDFDFSFYKY